MREKLQKAAWYIALLLKEQTTWRGIAFLVGLFSSHAAELDWGEAAAIGGTAAAMLKIILPENITKMKIQLQEKTDEKS